MLKPIALLNDHRLVDCGTGDYIIECPELGQVEPWLHMGLVFLVLERDCQCACGAVVNERKPPNASQLDRIEAKLDALLEALDGEDDADDTPVTTMLDGTPIE